jgi:cellobiose-specific phosphotransferase system component IIB
MAYDDTKVAGNLIKSADWNAFVTAYKTHSGANVHISGNAVLLGTDTEIKYDTTNETFDFTISGVQVADMDKSGNLRIKGDISVGETFS